MAINDGTMEGGEVAALIADYRRRRGITLHQLASELKVHWGTVWRWENNRRTPPAEVIRLALIGLDVERERTGDGEA